MNTYYLNTFYCTEQSWKYVSELQLNTIQKKFFCHVLACQLKNPYGEEDGRFPVSQVFVQQTLKPKNIREFYKWANTSPILDVASHDYEDGRSKAFRISDEIVAEFQSRNVIAENSIIMDSGSGKRKQKFLHTLFDDARHSIPTLAKLALSCIKPVPVNFEILKQYVSGLPATDVDSYNGKALLNTMVDGKYFAGYHMSRTGRVAENGFGLQACRAVMRTHAFAGMDIFNYDIANSQLNILRQCFEESNINCPFLISYLTDTAFQKSLFDKLPKSVIKPLLMSMCFRGFSTRTFSSMKEHHPKQLKKITKYYESIGAKMSEADYDKVLSDFCDMVAPLKTALLAWGKVLSTTYFAEHAKKMDASEKRYMRNAVGQVYCVTHDADGKERTKQGIEKEISIQLLQSREAAWIHTLTTLSSKYDFQVYVNCHDGLITNKEIPSAAMEEASKATNLKYISFIQKPL